MWMNAVRNKAGVGDWWVGILSLCAFSLPSLAALHLPPQPPRSSIYGRSILLSMPFVSSPVELSVAIFTLNARMTGPRPLFE